MNAPLLSLSLLNGQLTAVAFHRGRAVGQWECPDPVADFNGFAATLKRAVEETRCSASSVSLVLAHTRLTQQLVETPPVKGWNLRGFLERRVKQFKAFASDAAWSYQQTLPTKNAHAVILHLTSKPFLDQLALACEQRGLRLASVLPATTVLSRQLAQLPVSNEDVVLLAAETGSGTTVVVGRRDGQLYLGRSLSSSWKSSPERVNTDLNRTILYIKQQFGVAVNSVWLFGPGAEAQAGALQAAVGLPVRISPVSATPFYWNHEAAGLAADVSGNLISAEQQRAPQRRVLARATAIMIGVLALVALVVTTSVQMLAKDRKAQIRKLETKLDDLQERKDKLEQREIELKRQQEFVRIVSEDKVPAVGGWFLGHLGYILPADLLLTGVDLKLDDDLWRVQLAGTLQPDAPSDPTAVATVSVATLTERLAEGPFHLEPDHGFAESGAVASSSQRGDANLAGTGNARFFLKGVMR